MSYADKKRIEIEKRIARKVVKAALVAGYEVSVCNGGLDVAIARSTSEKAIMAAMFATDEERLYFSKTGQNDYFGWVYFVYGNDGPDVINDYTTNLEDLLKPINNYCAALDS